MTDRPSSTSRQRSLAGGPARLHRPRRGHRLCLGGGFALLLAADRGFDVASVNYGPVAKKTYTEATFTDACPIVASYGGKDPGDRGAGDRLERILTAVGVDHDVTTYPEAGHSFLNDHDRADLPVLFALQFRVTGNPYHEPSARDARRRILDFFARHLRTADQRPSTTA